MKVAVTCVHDVNMGDELIVQRSPQNWNSHFDDVTSPMDLDIYPYHLTVVDISVRTDDEYESNPMVCQNNYGWDIGSLIREGIVHWDNEESFEEIEI